MSNVNVLARINQAEESARQQAPKVCQGCPNFSMKRETGGIVLACALAAEGRPSHTHGLKVAETAEKIKTTLAIPNADSLNEIADAYVHISAVEAFDQAPEDCPIVERIVREVPAAHPNEPISLAPPEPLVPGFARF